MERARRGGALSSLITVRCILPLGMMVRMDGASERTWRVRDPLGFCVVLHESCAIETAGFFLLLAMTGHNVTSSRQHCVSNRSCACETPA
jgi:hypothetical protein